ncbi:MAG TPA: hypothetical protein VJB34_08465 [Bdellovibrionota bacterium]|nr:hypothetical protein [Bdellovibrionota bacterium]
MTILIIAALKEELKELKGYVKNSKQTSYKDFIFLLGKIKETKVLVVQSGIGMDRAARATQAALELINPSCIVTIGFCGATRRGLKVSDIVISQKLIFNHSEESQSYESNAQLIEVAESISKPKPLVGTTLTTHRPIYRSEIKQALGQRTNALALNMEGHAVACVAKQANIPFIEIRSVLDMAEEDLPHPFEDLKLPYFKRQFMNLKMMRHATRARKTLTPFVLQFLKKIPEKSF